MDMKDHLLLDPIENKGKIENSTNCAIGAKYITSCEIGYQTHLIGNIWHTCKQCPRIRSFWALKTCNGKPQAQVRASIAGLLTLTFVEMLCQLSTSAQCKNQDITLMMVSRQYYHWSATSLLSIQCGQNI